MKTTRAIPTGYKKMSKLDFINKATLNITTHYVK